ncbi:unnamed protein product [Cunninghamella blakesleeana]
MDNTQAPLSWFHVLESSSFVFIAALISWSLGLKLEIPFIISSLRCVLQLSMMGYVLDDVLKADNVWVVMSMSFILVLLGAYEIVFNRTKKTFKGLFPVMFFVLLASTIVICIIGIAVALQVTPFWQPTQFIPIIGMLLGNSMSSIAMATEYCLDHVSKHAPLLETRLAYGATRYEATKPLAIESIRLSLLPVITQLSVMGLINIPGTMVGLLIAGSPIKDAVIYQQVIMFMVVASSTVGSIFAVMICLKTVIDQHQVLRCDKIYDNKPLITKKVLRKMGKKIRDFTPITFCTKRNSRGRYEEVEMS